MSLVSRAAALLIALVSAIALAGAAAAQAPSRPAAPTAAFANERLADAGVRLEGELKAQVKLGNRNAAAWAKLAQELFDKEDWRKAADAFAAAAVAAPRDRRQWVGLAKALLAVESDKDEETRRLAARAAAAAYLGYQRATGAPAQADALATVAAALEAQEAWRPALDAYRASLALADNEEVRTAYDALREEHGFRITGETVDADTANPRICVEFSDPLADTRSDYAPYVAMRGAPSPTVTANGSQLCIEGLKHGQRYAFTIRAGVPSTVGEKLEKPSEFTLYVRDRKPEARFTGRNYVLPRTGQRGIPLVTVNTDLVKLDLYRVGDRSLAPTIVDEDFQSQLSSYQIETLGDERGQKIWSGEMSVERRQNAEVTTAFPITDTVGATQPGVYVLVASPKPESTTDDGWTPKATQWFVVSDLGITSFAAEEKLLVVLRSLAAATPVGNASVRLIAKNNEVLATATSDADGLVTFPGGLLRGSAGLAPALIVAEGPEQDYAFLDLTKPGFDLSDRGVAGRTAPGPVDAFVVTERGVYRPGETVHVTALARDAAANALPGLPLTLVVERPDGVEFSRSLVPDGGLGGRSLEVTMLPSATTGTWRIRAYSDPKRPAIAETAFLVEDYVPERIEVAAEARATTLPRSGDTPVGVTGRYLYGAPAAGLEASGEVVVSVAADAPGALKGYRFGVKDDEITAVRADIEPVTLDRDGKGTLLVPVPALPDTAQPLEAEITVRVAEPGGRAVARSITLPVLRDGLAVGVKPLFRDQVGDGDLARFDVVVADPQGRLVAQAGLTWSLLKVDTRFQWYYGDGSWRHESYETTSRVADGKLDATAEGPVRVEAPVAYGRYRLEVSLPGRPAATTSVTFDAGWYAVASSETPDLLRLVLDKPAYAPGEQATVTLEPRFPGRATLVVVGDRTQALRTLELEARPTEVKVPVEASWGPGAYVVALLHRPLDVQAGRMPGRAVGVGWVGIDRAPRTLAVRLDPPAEMEPNRSLPVPVRLEGLPPGEEAFVTVAAVDVGILNLTRYKAPAPEDWFYGQRKLGAEIRDLYGQLIDGMRAEVGAVRSGGDGSGMEIVGNPPAQAPLALFSGLVKVDRDGRADIVFDIPGFDGTVRVMAMAWSRDKLGHAEADVLVRDPVVVTATLPRFLAAGDRSTLRLDLDNVSGPAGARTLALSVEGPLSIAAADARRSVELGERGRASVAIPVQGTAAGIAKVAMSLTAADGKVIERSYTLGIRPTLPPVTRRTVTALAPRTGSVTVSPDLLADFVKGSGTVALSVSPAAINVPELLEQLDRYPYGCSEQITSRALPLLYVNELAKAVGMPADPALQARIREAIERVLARQDSTGSFGLWRPGDGDLWLSAYVTDFLGRAREKGFAVPDLAFGMALDNLRNELSYSSDFSAGEGAGVAYALYVLARNGRAPLGDLRYFAEEKIEDFGTPLARAQIGAALALLGDLPRAGRAFEVARASLTSPGEHIVKEDARDDYGSRLRDEAAILTLVAESRTAEDLVSPLVARIAEDRAKRRYTSTQENAWMVLAAQALAEQASRLDLSVNGTPSRGALSRTLRARDLESGPLTVQNLGEARAAAVVTVTGSPLVPEPAAEQGFAVQRRWYTLDGKEVKPDQVRQTTRLVTVLTVTESTPQLGHVLLVDRLPAGFEIDNPRLVDGNSLKALPFLPSFEEHEEDGGKPKHTEFRDDRFVAAFERKSDDSTSFTVAYVVRAVSPGRYVLPPATVEDMYRPERFGRTAAGTVEVTAGP